jgi:hypothetical protein
VITEVRNVVVKMYWKKINDVKGNTAALLVSSKEVDQEINAKEVGIC